MEPKRPFQAWVLPKGLRMLYLTIAGKCTSEPAETYQRTNETVAPVGIKDLTTNLIQLTFSPGAFQDKALININAFRDRCEFWYATESAPIGYPWKSV